MTAPDSLPLHALTEEDLAPASPDLLRQMIKAFADALMSADADTPGNAAYGQVSDERVNQAQRIPPTRVGHAPSLPPGVPPAPAPSSRRSRNSAPGSYFPTWLPERHRRAEQALITVGIRHRTDIAGIFHDRTTLPRPDGTLLAEQNDEWTSSPPLHEPRTPRQDRHPNESVHAETVPPTELTA